MRHYDHHHDTVAEARECEARREAGTTITKPQPISAKTSVVMDRLRRQATTPLPALAGRSHKTGPLAGHNLRDGAAYAHRPAHPKRVAYANDLLRNRYTASMPKDFADLMVKLLDGKPFTDSEIDRLIKELQAQPRLTPEQKANRVEVLARYAELTGQTTTQPAEMPAKAEATPEATGPSLRDLCADLADKGYYALLEPGTENKIHYYRITRSKKGYVKVQEQASDELYPVDYRRAMAVVKDLLESGVEAARHLYADTLERCYRCGRTLTDETSRELRIGPDCRTK